MNNPYEILGIDQNATDEQIKAAYLQMQKKYHPDNYQDSPLKEQAEEKTKEITEAFDQIMNERRKNEAQSGKASKTVVTEDGTYHEESTGGNESFENIRYMIQNNRLVEAEEILDKMPQDARNAEWYFLKGSIFFSRGWLDDATSFFETACRMNPNNAEYQTARNRVMWQRRGNFGTPNQPYGVPQPGLGGCSACDICSGLICADCCCECMGGDFIPCC